MSAIFGRRAFGRSVGIRAWLWWPIACSAAVVAEEPPTAVADGVTSVARDSVREAVREGVVKNVSRD